MNKQVKQIVSQLKKGKLFIQDISEEYRENIDIINAERELNLRKICRCGYDIINNRFFVKEKVLYHTEESGWSYLSPRYFDDFESYCCFLSGNIYDNACYYQLDPKKVPDGIDQTKLYEKKALVEYTIDDYTLLPSIDEQARYDEVEKRKPEIKNWIEQFNKCLSYQQLNKTVKKYHKSDLGTELDVSFFFWNYIFDGINDNLHFQAIMEYMSSGIYPAIKICKALCTIYNPDDVVSNYNYQLGEYPTRRQHIRAMKQIADKVRNKEYIYHRRAYFDSNTHYYCVETKAYEHNQKWAFFEYYEYFESEDKFIERLNGDLTNCDLSKAPATDKDYSKCTVNNTTILPININEKYDYSVKKYFNNNSFNVRQIWKSKNGSIVKKYMHHFDYFFDFIAFLKGDLSHADLISCDGLVHLNTIEQINLQDAFLTSSICEKLGIKYARYEIDAPLETSFALPEKNEAETTLVLQSSRDLAEKDNNTNLAKSHESYDSPTKRIYYISDIHLYHLLKNKNPRSKTDIIRIIRDVVSTIINESDKDSIILVNGDTSLNYTFFQLFVYELKQFCRTIIFTIGNHDIWSFPDDTIDQLSEKYRSFLQSNEMYLLQNDVLFFNDFDQPPERIDEKELNRLSEEMIRKRVKYARLILFGGTGFAGYNHFFNADNGLYRYNNIIGYNREIEIKETQRFEALYKKICKAFHGKSTIIMTHMPLPDWYKSALKHRDTDYSKETEYRTDHPDDNIGTYYAYHPGFIYVSGHTHRNYYYDDGEIRIYSDNQFGYNKGTPSAWPHLKYFEVEKAIDYFADYCDGIYEITADEYRQFYRGKNIMMDFTREVNIIYMLRKNGYYCFIHKAKNGCLSIMNGGSLRHLGSKDINYYYDHMDLVIKLLKDPLDKYTAFQKKLSDEIKKLGGVGSIHGCIVDIDFYNHVYVNPLDGSITAYWASDIINKMIYPTIPSLLEARCPRLFDNYKLLIGKGAAENLSIISIQNESRLALAPIPYFDTDIYKASRQIKKMQKLNSNILSTWPEVDALIHKDLEKLTSGMES